MTIRFIALPLAALGFGLMGIAIYVFASSHGGNTFFCSQNSDQLKSLFVALGIGVTALAAAGTLLGWRPALRLPVQLLTCWTLVALAVFWLVPLVPECPIFD